MSHSSAFGAALLNAQDAVADQSSLAPNARWFLDASWQKSTENLFMRLLDQFQAKGLVLRSNISEDCGVIVTTARVRHEDIRQVIAESLDRTRNLPKFGANDNSAGGSSSGTSDDDGNSGDAGTFSSLHRICH